MLRRVIGRLWEKQGETCPKESLPFSQMLGISVTFCPFLSVCGCSLLVGLSLILPKVGIPEVRTVEQHRNVAERAESGRKAGFLLVLPWV